MRFLHFSDNEQPNLTNNKVYKTENVRNQLLKNFQNIIMSGRDLVIDESMIPFRGRLLFQSHKYGFKIYKLCTVDE